MRSSKKIDSCDCNVLLERDPVLARGSLIQADKLTGRFPGSSVLPPLPRVAAAVESLL